MDKNKQTKKRKLKTKLISIAMLAIILVTMFALPTSATSADFPELVGQWKIGENFAPVDYNGINSNIGYNVSIRFPYLNTDTNTVEYLEWRSACFVLNVRDATECGFEVINGYSNQDQYISYQNGVIYQYVPDHSATIRIGDEFYDELRIIEFIDDTVTGWGNEYVAEDFYTNVQTFMTPYVPPEPKTPLGNILDVFLGIGGWIATAVTSLIGIFYSAEAGKLTVIGVLSVASLAISVIFLLIGVIQNFMHFRS